MSEYRLSEEMYAELLALSETKDTLNEYIADHGVYSIGFADGGKIAKAKMANEIINNIIVVS